MTFCRPSRRRALVSILAGSILRGRCRVALKSETARVGRYSLPLNVRFCFQWRRFSLASSRYLINCSKQTGLLSIGAQQGGSCKSVGTAAEQRRFDKRMCLSRSDGGEAEDPDAWSGVLQCECLIPTDSLECHCKGDCPHGTPEVGGTVGRNREFEMPCPAASAAEQLFGRELAMLNGEDRKKPCAANLAIECPCPPPVP